MEARGNSFSALAGRRPALLELPSCRREGAVFCIPTDQARVRISACTGPGLDTPCFAARRWSNGVQSVVRLALAGDQFIRPRQVLLKDRHAKHIPEKVPILVPERFAVLITQCDDGIAQAQRRRGEGNSAQLRRRSGQSLRIENIQSGISGPTEEPYGTGLPEARRQQRYPRITRSGVYKGPRGAGPRTQLHMKPESAISPERFSGKQTNKVIVEDQPRILDLHPELV